jgi:hypothetical protein
MAGKHVNYSFDICLEPQPPPSVPPRMGAGKQVYVTGARFCSICFVIFGSVIICRLYKLTLSDQAQIALQLRVSLSDSSSSSLSSARFRLVFISRLMMIGHPRVFPRLVVQYLYIPYHVFKHTLWHSLICWVKLYIQCSIIAVCSGFFHLFPSYLMRVQRHSWYSS